MPLHNLKKIARWESAGGRYWVDLFFDPAFELADGRKVRYAQYQCDNGGGSLHVNDAAHAIRQVQARVDEGQFQADKNKTPMKRVF